MSGSRKPTKVNIYLDFSLNIPKNLAIFLRQISLSVFSLFLSRMFAFWKQACPLNLLTITTSSEIGTPVCWSYKLPTDVINYPCGRYKITLTLSQFFIDSELYPKLLLWLLGIVFPSTIIETVQCHFLPIFYSNFLPRCMSWQFFRSILSLLVLFSRIFVKRNGSKPFFQPWHDISKSYENSIWVYWPFETLIIANWPKTSVFKSTTRKLYFAPAV